jgi:hypothetical protein
MIVLNGFSLKNCIESWKIRKYTIAARQGASRPREGTIPPEQLASTEHQPHFCPSSRTQGGKKEE